MDRQMQSKGRKRASQPPLNLGTLGTWPHISFHKVFRAVRVVWGLVGISKGLHERV